MADEQGISAHGTIIRVRPAIADPTPANAWAANETIEIMELGDITGIGTTRNEHDITSHNRDIDTWIFGVARRNLLQFPVFFNKAIISHRLMRTLQANNDVTTQMKNGFEVEGPDGDLLIFSGGVKDMPRDAPVDGPQTAQIGVRPTGPYYLNGVLYGA